MSRLVFSEPSKHDQFSRSRSLNIQAIVLRHVEMICLLSKLNIEHHVEVEVDLDEMDLTAAESKATYGEFKE